MSRELVDCGVDWIGKIPKDWSILRLGAIFYRSNQKNTNRNETNVLSLMKDIGVIPYSEKGAVGNNASEDIERYFLVEENDIIMNSMNVIIGSVGKSKYKGCLSQVYHVLRIRNNLRNSANYYDYLFASRQFQRKLVGYGNGIMEHRMRIPMSKLKIIVLPNPQLYIQQAIANFLDNKTNKIDELIKVQETAIERLKEYKQSVITEAVTKGLDPSVKMKDSGIDWIGYYPCGWNLSRLKFNVKIVNNRNIDSKRKYFGLENIESWSGRYIETDNDYDKTQAIACEPGYVAFGKLRPYLAKSYLVLDAMCCSSEFAVMDYVGYNKYFHYFTLNHWFVNVIDSSTYGTKMPRANINFIKNLDIINPQYSDQVKIVDYLDKKTEEINQLIQLKKDKIEKLKEYKKSLIYEAVTGKIEVI